MTGPRKALSALLLASLFAMPLSVLAEEGLPIANPAVEIAEQANVELEEDAGEILATSSEAVAEVIPEALPEEESVEESSEIELLDPESYVAGEVIVKFEDEEETVVVETENVAELIEELSSDPDVEYAEPNYVRSIVALSITTDPRADQLWGLEVTQASDAWVYSTGTDVIVAIIDTGVDYTHPEFAGRMWSSDTCYDENGSLIAGGCENGWDFSTEEGDGNPMPEDDLLDPTDAWWHGTHVAGTIAANFNNHQGIIGMAPGVKIMALRFALDVESEVRAIKFAKNNGARIINASYAGSGFSDKEQNAILAFENAGGLFIAAAANNSSDNDSVPAYPASYDFESVISVAATDSDDELASFSNYGEDSVDLGAPGVDIVSAYPGNKYAVADGTSMAVPHVVGVAALIQAFRPALGADDVKELILEEGDPVDDLQGTTVSGNRLNAYKALVAAETLTADTSAPVVTLNGEAIMHLMVGDPFIDPGASALDETDGDVSGTIVVSGTADGGVAGTYVITYTATDLSGNVGSATRDVVVSPPETETEQTPSRRGGGGGGGGGDDDNPIRLPRVLGSSSLSPEVQARIAYLTALVQKLLVIIAAMKAAGIE